MKLALIFSFICGTLSWTVDIEKIDIVVSDVNGRNSAASTNFALAEEFNEEHEDTEYAKNYVYNQDYFTETEALSAVNVSVMNDLNVQSVSWNTGIDTEPKKMTNILQNGSQFLETINKTFSNYKDILKKCITTNETRYGTAESDKKESPSSICVAVLRDSGDIRRLIAVLFSATGEMRDEVDQNTKVEDELESLVRVAWLLDRLARLTDLARYASHAPHATAAQAADLRTSRDAQTEPRVEESSEILEQAENRSGGSGRASAARRRRRSAARPLQELASYYLKYKSWTNSNAPASGGPDDNDFDVRNHLDTKSVSD